jgi:DNA polymerase III sliding clamp (beta) subunit (PCNA family)
MLAIITAMRVFVDRKEFEEVLKKTRLATQKRANMPILNNLKLSAEEDKLSIYTTNLESFLVMELPARVEEAGTACCSCKQTGFHSGGVAFIGGLYGIGGG